MTDPVLKKITDLTELTTPATDDWFITVDVSEPTPSLQTKKIKGGAFQIYLASQLGANVVETAKIKDLNVTTGKINDLAVVEGKIADGSVTVNKLGALAVTNAKLALLAVGTGNLVDLAVTAAKIAAATITPAKTSFSDAITKVYYGAWDGSGNAIRLPVGWTVSLQATGLVKLTHGFAAGTYGFVVTCPLTGGVPVIPNTYQGSGFSYIYTNNLAGAAVSAPGHFVLSVW